MQPPSFVSIQWIAKHFGSSNKRVTGMIFVEQLAFDL